MNAEWPFQKVYLLVTQMETGMEEGVANLAKQEQNFNNYVAHMCL